MSTKRTIEWQLAEWRKEHWGKIPEFEDGYQQLLEDIGNAIEKKLPGVFVDDGIWEFDLIKEGTAAALVDPPFADYLFARLKEASKRMQAAKRHFVDEFVAELEKRGDLERYKQHLKARASKRKARKEAKRSRKQ